MVPPSGAKSLCVFNKVKGQQAEYDGNHRLAALPWRCNPRPACLTWKHGCGVASTSAWRSATASSRCCHLAALQVGPARVMTGKPDAPPGLFDRPVLIVDPGMHTAKIWRVFKNTPAAERRPVFTAFILLIYS
jgi:hypothetical protein